MEKSLNVFVEQHMTIINENIIKLMDRLKMFDETNQQNCINMNKYLLSINYHYNKKGYNELISIYHEISDLLKTAYSYEDIHNNVTTDILYETISMIEILIYGLENYQ